MLVSLLPNKNRPSSFQYTVELPDAPEVAGEGKPRRYYKSVGKELVSHPEGIHNLHQNFLHGVSVSGDVPCLGKRSIVDGKPGPYEWQTYKQVLERVTKVGTALVRRGLKREAMVGLFSINNSEWIIAEQACFMYDFITVPLYDTLGAEAIEYIVTSTSTSIVFATSDKAKILVTNAKQLTSLKTIVAMDTPPQELVDQAKASGIELVSIADLESEGAKDPLPKADTLSLDSTATICYTSGTTGLPKGVMISHRNLLSFVAAYIDIAKNGDLIQLGKDDVHISYLPLAHILERIIFTTLLYLGARAGFFQGDTLKLLDDVAELKPTIFPSVPRLYNRIYDKINAGIAAKGGVAAILFNYAFNTKKEYVRKGYLTHSLWDAVVFDKIKQRLGGRVRMCMSGAAPISADVLNFMRVCFGCDFIEGYGQTETTGAVSFTLKTDTSVGHIGIPIPSCMIKLRDVPSMNYTSKDQPNPRGEIMIKGSNCFSGYYKAPDKTAETIVDGWVATGDVGMWDTQGRLKIIDRVKNIFKLAQGEYIAPEKIEIVYNKHSLIAQSFVYGDSLKASLVAIIVPDWETSKPWSTSKGFNHVTINDFCNDANVNKQLLKIIEQHGKENGLKGFENVKAIHLCPDPFTPENGLLSPTFKLKRHEAKKFYQKELDQLYASIE
ncbi:hypothetical protein EDD86DRAFT_201962 [Gorgonomyces haynaldii]|nr:hypothetical protein EDD86DRAFT_201962 [Gorgonomyces haynaldii]